MTTSSGGKQTTRTDGARPEWRAKPWAARAVRAVQVVVPFLAGWLAIRVLEPFFYGSGSSRLAELTWWLLQAILVAVAVSAAVARVLRALTPLSTLLNMTLVFPDSVPSRFGLALRAGNVKHLLAQPSIRLSPSAQIAAEQAVQLVTHLAKHEPLTRGHTERVRAYADLIGQQMGLSDNDLNGLRWGALLHDVGKLTVPPELLNKPGKPTDEEWEILRGHPGAAVPILAPLEGWLGEWLLAAPQHHERWDGSGYPNQLTGLEISLAGRITAVADAYDVITSRRSYKAPQSAEDARAEMVRSAGSHFDPVVVRALLEVGVVKDARARRFGWVLELPGLARLFTSVGQIAAGAAIAVGLSVSAPFIAAAAVSDGDETADAPESAAFIASLADEGTPVLPTTTGPTSESDEPPAVDAPSETSTSTSTPLIGAPVETTSSTASVATTTTLSVSVSVPPSSVTTTSTQPTTSTTSTIAPATTTTTTTTTSTTTTTTVVNNDCSRAQQGETFLPNADLRGCDLSNRTLDGLHLTNAQLEEIDFSDSLIKNFNFEGASLDGADLSSAHFESGSMVNASLVGVVAQGVEVDQVDFYSANLRSSDFAGGRFRSASFGFANLRNSTFAEVIFVDTNFNDATLANAAMNTTQLSGAEFYRARIRGMDLADSNLTGAVFADATGTPVNSATATFNRTKCPDGTVLNRDCWAVR